MVHEVQHSLQLFLLDAFQVEEWVGGVGIVAQYPPEEGGACGQDDLVGADPVGPVVTAQSYVEEFRVPPELAKTRTDVRLEVIPPAKIRVGSLFTSAPFSSFHCVLLLLPFD